MSIDVINVNNLRACSAGFVTCATELTCLAAMNSLWGTDTTSWDSTIPAAPTGGTVLCVGCMRVGTDTLLRCGATCSWTVPAGVTRALFELWGPGGGTMPGCCCAIMGFGFTGEYVAICRPVQEGATYFLNAGCANCCYACQGVSSGLCGSCTYVCQCGANTSSGCGCFLNGLVTARSGRGNWYYNRIISGLYGTPYCNLLVAGGGTNYTNIRAPFSCSQLTASVYYGSPFYMSGIGIGICSCGESCMGSSQCTAGVIPSVPLFNHSVAPITCADPGNYCLNCTGQRYNGVFIPSRSPEMCITGGSLCGYIKHPAIPGFANTSQCCVSWTSTQSTFGGALCSPINGNNYLTAPGSGGNMVYTVGGCNSNCGDAGRGGMVRVTFC